MTEHHSGCDSTYIEFRKGEKKLSCFIINWNISSKCLCERVYGVSFFSCEQSSELLTSLHYFVLNTTFIFHFVLLDFENEQIQGNPMQKMAVSEGVFLNVL